jgi:hypothetical protein
LRGVKYDAIGRSEVLAGLDHELLLRLIDILSPAKAAKALRAALNGRAGTR